MSTQWLRSYKILCYGIFFLVALGGSVRAMNAGLACPDWPLCFGDVIPDYHPEVYFEFIHRALAGVIGIVSVILNIKLIRHMSAKRSEKIVAAAAIVLLLAQVVMGGLTVLLQLHAKIVALHLGMGTGFFALSVWIYLSQKYRQRFPGGADSHKAKWAGWVLLSSIYGQIILGGLVASHYAALVCTEFPKCQGEWIPTFNGIIGLHVIHRLGAYLLTAIVIGYVIFIYRRVSCLTTRYWAKLTLVLLLVQVSIGIANVLLFTPPLITVLHLAAGTALLGVATRQVRLATYEV
jgi:cytochrome c oxidase assembly protein subunit 15